MTVKELLQKEPYPDTLVGIYKIVGKPEYPMPLEQFLGTRKEALESRYADCEVDDWTEGYHNVQRTVGIIIYIKNEEV